MQRIDVSNLNFLRIEPRGKAVLEKFWVNDNGVIKLVKTSDNNDQDIMEYLTSIILKKLDISCVDVELGIDGLSGKNCCLVTSFLTDEADVSYDMYEWNSINTTNDENDMILCFEQVFDKFSNLHMLTEFNFQQLKKQYIRILLGKCLTENIDAKLENIGLIFNEKTKQYRLPPSYDNGFAFSSYKSIGTPYCCVGYQYFEVPSIVNYIIDNYFEYVEDIVENLKKLLFELDSIVEKIKIDIDKKQYIIDYMKKMYKYIEDIKEKCK